METHKLKILYAEDESITRVYLSEVMNSVANVIPAENGQEALELFKSQKFDMLVTDLSMPRMNGSELIIEIKKIDKDFPCIVTTAHKGEFEQIENLAVIIEKPVKLKVLMDRIKEIQSNLNLNQTSEH